MSARSRGPDIHVNLSLIEDCVFPDPASEIKEISLKNSSLAALLAISRPTFNFDRLYEIINH